MKKFEFRIPDTDSLINTSSNYKIMNWNLFTRYNRLLMLKSLN